MRIRLTKHARTKISERKIPLSAIEKIVARPELQEKDKFDDSLVHFIGRIEKRFLRVIGRWGKEDEFIVVSAFFDRRLKERGMGDAES